MITRGISLLALASIAFCSCTLEETLNIPQDLSATDGTYIGTVLLNWGQSSGAEAYQIHRLDPQTGEWVDAGHWAPPPYWDLGWGSSTNTLIPGYEYQYKCRGHKNGPGFSDFGDIETGHTFIPSPVEITSVTREEDGKVKIEWTDPNDLSMVVNHLSTYYRVYKAPESNMSNISQIDGTSGLFVYDDYANEEPHYYAVAIRYGFSVDQSHGFIEYDASEMVKEGAGGNGGNPVVNYTKSELDNLSSSGGIPFVEMKMANGTSYLGTLEEYVTDGGQPKIYRLNGTSWQPEGGTLPSELTSDNFARMSIAAGSSNTFIAASKFVFASDGSSWSDNLASDKMGEAEAPSIASIEVFNDELYALAHVDPDDDLKVFKWSGTDWATVGGDAGGWIDPGEQVSEASLERIDGTLYMYYLINNTSSNSTLKIMHLNGASWETDLAWNHDYLYDIQIAKGSSNLYFSSSSLALGSYRGGVYKVTSASSVEAIADENNDWFWTPYDLAMDSDDNLILSSQIFASQNEVFPGLSLFDGSGWKTISGDFSGGADPVAIGVAGTDIYFVRGDLSSEDMQMDPTVLISSKLTK